MAANSNSISFKGCMRLFAETVLIKVLIVNKYSMNILDQ